MAFEVRARIGLDNSPLHAGLEQSKSAVRNFGRSINGHLSGELAGLKGQFAAAFGIAAITSAIAGVVELGGKISDTAARTGMTTDEVQSLGFAAEQTGASIEDIASALKKLAIAKTEAMGGNREKQTQFAQMGVDMAAIRQSMPMDLFRSLGDEIGKGAMSAEQLTAALGLMGKSADSLFPAFKQGMSGLIADFERLKLGIDPATVEALDNLGDKWDQLKLKFKAILANEYKALEDNTLGLVQRLRLQWDGLRDLFTDPDISGGFGANVENAAEKWAEAIKEADESTDNIMAQQRQMTERLEKNQARNKEIREAEEKASLGGDIEIGARAKWLERMKKNAGGAVNFQFNELARVGGFLMDAPKTDIAIQLLNEVKSIRQVLLKGNLGDDLSMAPLL